MKTIDGFIQSLQIPDILALVPYIFIFAVFLYRFVSSKERMAFTSYRVVLVGPARIGKTTTIIAALDQIRRGKVSGGLARLRSESTIARVSKLTAMLNSGKFPPATKEDETNIYRFDYAFKYPAPLRAIMRFAGISTLYRVEVADFAGEQSERYFTDTAAVSPHEMPDDYGPSAAHNFLKWISESDACIIFIDCEEYSVRGQEYVDAITEKYITFWSFYLDVHADNIFSSKAPPVIIVYSKGDKIRLSSSRGDASPAEVANYLDSRFLELVSFLRRNSSRVRTIQTSAVSRTEDGERLGVAELVTYMLPGK